MTGEDLLELHIHGGPATVKAVLGAIARSDSDHVIRYAEAGEFTRRAFQNGRLDLGQVEALSDALSAETEQQRRAAMRGNSGKLGKIYDEWRQLLLSARGELEALIDFSEDQHFDEQPAELMRNVTKKIGFMQAEIRRHQAGSRCGELLKKGIRISLIGRPNAGKSSLLNLIVGREAAIVSPEAGTTRDVVEVNVNIGGYLCVFADTAGLRTTAVSPRNKPVDAVELEGMRRAKVKAKESDMVLALASVEFVDDPDRPGVLSYDPHLGLGIVCDIDSLSISDHTILLINKCDAAYMDLVPKLVTRAREHLICGGVQYPPIFSISCHDALSYRESGKEDPGNIQGLLSALERNFEEMTHVAEEDVDFLGVSERKFLLRFSEES